MKKATQRAAFLENEDTVLVLPLPLTREVQLPV